MKHIKALLILVTILIVGCVPQSDFDKLKAEKAKLSAELEECKNGAEKLIAKIEKNYKEKNYLKTKDFILALANKHPEAPQNKKYSKLLKKIEYLIKQEEIKKKKEDKRKRAIENANKLGMWMVTYYVDDFGEPTKSGYIRNENSILGTFSNSATQDAKLRVTLMLTKYTDADIQLYEYGGRNPVKAYMNENYQVLVKDNKGRRYKLTGKIHTNSDRISLDGESSKKLHSILKRGGNVEFRIKHVGRLDEYNFSLNNADWYYNAYKKLHKIK